MTQKFFTASNILSIVRALLTIPFVSVMLGDGQASRLWGCVIMAAAGITDKLDGVLARKYGQVTEWGKILDPLADKIGVAVVAIVLLVLRDIPVWFVLVVIGRDALIVLGGMYIKARWDVILPSNEMGKWAVGVISLTLFLAVAGLRSPVVDILLWLTVAMLAVSLYFYFLRFIEMVKSAARP